MIETASLGLMEDLLQNHYDGHYYDFHNDYNCEKISYSEGILSLHMKSMIGEVNISISFLSVEIIVMNMFNVREIEGLTIDSLYRGRFESFGKLHDLSQDGKGYIYLEFYEGQKLEFWATIMRVERE